MPKNSSKVSTFTLKRIRDLKNNMINVFSKVLDDLLEHILACHYFTLNPFNAELLGTLASQSLNSWGGGGEKKLNIS